MDELENSLKEFEKDIDTYIVSLTTWLKMMTKKTGSEGVVLSMSGTLNEIVVAVLCKRAHIPMQVIAMPKEKQVSDEQMAMMDKMYHQFGIEVEILQIGVFCDIATQMCLSFKDKLAKKKIDCKGNIEIANANIVSIQRMQFVSTLAQYLNYAMIGTIDYTDRHMGFFTKRGNGLFDFNPLGDYTKSEIQILARHIGISEDMIQKEPTKYAWFDEVMGKDIEIDMKEVDRYLLTDGGENEIVEIIERKHQKDYHKIDPNPVMPAKWQTVNKSS